MKKSIKIILSFVALSLGILATGFLYEFPDRHAPCVFVEKMNVFYIGVDNPISITACGLAPSDVRIAITGGTIVRSGKPGYYIVRVSGGVQSTLNISMSKDSVTKSLGMYQFRIKRVPDPVCYIGNLKGDGMMSPAELQGQSGLFARMENFDFDLKFNIISFRESMLMDGVWKENKSNGPAITPEMKSDLKLAKAKDKVIFDQVVVKGPDGTLRKIPGVFITIK